jgi:hypothetical protein
MALFFSFTFMSGPYSTTSPLPTIPTNQLKEMLEAQGDDPLEEEALAQVHDETERHIQMHLAGRNGAE